MSAQEPLIFGAPSPLRRLLYTKLRRGHFASLQRLRVEPSADSYSLTPFVERRAIFVHIPKTAGVSVCRSLFGNLAGGHTNIVAYSVIFSSEEFRSFFKFAFVRNPWDRLHSAYHFLRRGGWNGTDRAFAEAHLEYDSFADFVLHGLRRPEVASYTHFVPQHAFVVLPGRRDHALDFVGRFERLADDYEVIAARVPGAEPLRHDNPTNERPDYRDEYTDEARRVVAEVYRRDIELFGYAF